mmetsp:Transcript_103589/g.259793  ORF Transcript_103589/g.259793 Transcript_103589/m.259793 type:complete len:105 (-) Transcript_103589:140-454(-)
MSTQAELAATAQEIRQALNEAAASGRLAESIQAVANEEPAARERPQGQGTARPRGYAGGSREEDERTRQAILQGLYEAHQSGRLAEIVQAALEVGRAEEEMPIP